MTTKNKDVRTKTPKSERVEFRCTAAFKAALTEIAEQNSLTVTALVEGLCTDRIREHFSSMSVQNTTPEPTPEPTPKPEPKPKDTPSRDHANDYDLEIWRLMQEGRTPTETAAWLNENGYTPQRGDAFTMNSVHSIRRRLKRQKSEH